MNQPDTQPAGTTQLTLPGYPTESDWIASAESTEGNYTGARLFQNEPRLYHAIIELLGAKVPIRTISRVLRVSIKTVMNVRECEPDSIAACKERLSTRLMGLGELQAEIAMEQLAALMERGDSLDAKAIKDILIGMGIVLEKGLLTGGESTSRITYQGSEPTHDDFNQRIRDVTAEVTHLSVETRGTKEGAPESAGRLEAGLADGTTDGTDDRPIVAPGAKDEAPAPAQHGQAAETENQQNGGNPDA